jgi:four helix bundle protein
MPRTNVIQEKSCRFSLKIIQLIKHLPRRTEGFVIGNQILRSGTSIGANVEEAIAGFSKEDFTYKMNIAVKEARETKYWLRLISDSRLIETGCGSLIQKCDELVKILTSIVKTSQGK